MIPACDTPTLEMIFIVTLGIWKITKARLPLALAAVACLSGEERVATVGGHQRAKR